MPYFPRPCKEYTIKKSQWKVNKGIWENLANTEFKMQELVSVWYLHQWLLTSEQSSTAASMAKMFIHKKYTLPRHFIMILELFSKKNKNNDLRILFLYFHHIKIPSPTQNKPKRSEEKNLHVVRELICSWNQTFNRFASGLPDYFDLYVIMNVIM